MSQKNSRVGNICTEIMTLCAVSNMRKLTRLATNTFNAKIKPTGLRTTQYCVLMAIGANPGKPLTHYAEELGMDLSTLARSLDTMTDSGFVELQSGNRREKLAYLTEVGEEKIVEVYPLWEEAQSEFINAFGKEEWLHYLDAASKYI